MKKRTLPVIALVCASVALSGCESKALTGAAAGAAAGAIAGKSTGNHKDKRLWIGAAIGALTGAAVGGYMDAQEAKFRQELANTGIEVTRDGNNIHLTMPSNITFSSGEASLASSAYAPLDSIAAVMKEYNKTLLSIDGFTDSTGSAAVNMALSEQRAISVKEYLAGQGIDLTRMITQGMGSANPIASNDTAAGRAMNRRVEIQIIPNQA